MPHKERNNLGNNKLKAKVKERHIALNGMIDNLSVLLSDVSSNIDREFLAAYKSHVVEVQSELKSLKQQVICFTVILSIMFH